MAKKTRSPKQKAATRKLVALNKARGKGGSKKRKTTESKGKRRSSPRRASVGPLEAAITPLGDLSTQAANAAMGLGTASAFTGVLLGRTIVHPAGGLNDMSRPDGETLEIVNPFTGSVDQSIRPAIDVVQMIGGQRSFAGQPTTFNARIRAASAAIGYNFRSAFHGKGSSFVWGPVAVGVGAKVADAVLIPLANNLARGGDNLIAGIGVGR